MCHVGSNDGYSRGYIHSSIHAPIHPALHTGTPNLRFHAQKAHHLTPAAQQAAQ